MKLSKAIARANAILPGTPVKKGRDPRWQAIINISDHIESEPEEVWAFIRRWGAHEQEDLRLAIAACLLEHLMEHHFNLFFVRIKEWALAEPLFADTLQRCWAFGQSEEPDNARKLKTLLRRLARHRAKATA